MYKGKITITSQLTGHITDVIIIPKIYKTKNNAIKAAKKLGNKIESHYSIYSNMEYSIITV